MAKRRKFFRKQDYYFYKFPKFNYDLNGDGRAETEVMNFLHRWAFRKSVKENISAYSEWIIRDQDSLFSIAEALYNSQHYYWIIMMMNDIIDPRFDWPLNETDFVKYIKAKYGEENIYNHHHYEADTDENIFSVPDGTWVSFDYSYNKISINNFDYEALINEQKRYIKLLKPEFLEEVKREKNEILSTTFETRRETGSRTV